MNIRDLVISVAKEAIYKLDEYLTLKIDKTKDLSSENEMLDDLSRSV